MQVDDPISAPPAFHEVQKGRFLTACDFFTRSRWLAYALAIPTVGCSVALCGVGLANGSKPSLVKHWLGHPKLRKLIIAGGLLWMVLFLFTTFRAISSMPILLLLLPLYVLSILASADYVYSLFRKHDQFLLSLVLLNYGNYHLSSPIPRGLESLSRKWHPEVRRSLGLLWAWSVGFAYFGTILAALSLVVAGIYIACAVAILVVGIYIALSIFGSNESDPPPPPPPPPPEVPPIPWPNCRAYEGRGTLGQAYVRVGDEIREESRFGSKLVGFVRDGIVYRRDTAFSSTPLYIFNSNDVLDYRTREVVARVQENYIIEPYMGGDVLYTLQPGGNA